MGSKLAIVAALLVAGCTTTTTGRPLEKARPPDAEPGNALIFGRSYFHLDGFLGEKGYVRDNLELYVTEYWPAPSKRRKEHRVTTDETGYYELKGMDPTHGYNVTKVIFPAGDQAADVEMKYRSRPDYRVLSLGELVCTIHEDGSADYRVIHLNDYDLTRPLIQHALRRHARTRWEELIKKRYIRAKATGGY